MLLLCICVMALETVTCLCKPEITMQEPAIAQAFDMKQPSFSEENVVEEPAPAEEAARRDSHTKRQWSRHRSRHHTPT